MRSGKSQTKRRSSLRAMCVPQAGWLQRTSKACWPSCRAPRPAGIAMPSRVFASVECSASTKTNWPVLPPPHSQEIQSMSKVQPVSARAMSWTSSSQ